MSRRRDVEPKKLTDDEIEEATKFAVAFFRHWRKAELDQDEVEQVVDRIQERIRQNEIKRGRVAKTASDEDELERAGRIAKAAAEEETRLELRRAKKKEQLAREERERARPPETAEEIAAAEESGRRRAQARIARQGQRAMEEAVELDASELKLGADLVDRLNSKPPKGTKK
jgi:hypothetical protein